MVDVIRNCEVKRTGYNLHPVAMYAIWDAYCIEVIILRRTTTTEVNFKFDDGAEAWATFNGPTAAQGMREWLAERRRWFPVPTDLRESPEHSGFELTPLLP